MLFPQLPQFYVFFFPACWNLVGELTSYLHLKSELYLTENPKYHSATAIFSENGITEAYEQKIWRVGN